MKTNIFRMRNKYRNVFLAIAVCSLFASCSNNQTENTLHYTKMVKTAVAEKIPSVYVKQFPGIIKEDNEVNLSFRVAGPILKYHVKEGDYIKKGQLIAEMDPRDYQVQKQAIQTQVTQLQSEYKRVKELNDRKSLADNDYEKMKAGKELAEAKLKNAIDQLNDTKLYAPFSGYITKTNYENGEIVNTGMPVASIIKLGLLKIEINIPATLYLKRDLITKIECTQNELPNQTFNLSIDADAKKANSSGLYTLYLSYPSPANSKLTPGMNVSVNVYLKNELTNGVKIPASALFDKDGKNFVWLVSDSTVTAKQITTDNIFNDGFINVTSGLNPNDQVVTGGLNLLSEGEKVKVVPKMSKSNIGNIL
ncbi:MAG: efflux RND transporter periplasmic adaptor subunit [Trichloromonas sp.]|nr:efflux RND transporter periplasmic adaptor subunit [Bacteroidales bacterium]MDX9710733.1 efflux RND transporter periplasmic adaptor subunit [Trichloromonas sp.]